MKSNGSILYVSTKEGIYTIDENNKVEEIAETKELDITCISSYNSVLYYSCDGSVYKLDGNKSNKINEYENIKCILAVANGIYLGTNDGKVISILDGKETIYDVSLNHSINNICNTSNGIFIGSDSGVYRLLNDSIDEVEGIQNNSGITSIIEDYESTLWISSSKGVSKIQTNMLENLFVKYNIESKQVNVTYFYNDLFYVGTEKGLFIIDEVNDCTIENDLTNQLKDIRIRDIIGYKDTLYIGTYDTDSYDIVTYFNEEIDYINSSIFISDCTKSEYKTLGQIRCFNVMNDFLVIGTNFGITTYDGTNFKTTNTLVTDTEGNTKRVGTTARPLYLFLTKDYILSCSQGDGIEVYDYELNFKGIVPGTEDQVILRCTNYKDKLIYGCGNEIYSYEVINGEDKTTKLPLVGNGSVTAIHVNAKTIAICTTSEIFYYNRASLENGSNDYIRIGLSDGLFSGVTANGNSYYNAEKNIYYFSCKDGIYKLDYDNFVQPVNEIKIAINNITLDGENYDDFEQVSLDKNNSRFVVDISILSFKDYQHYKVYYKLAEYDKKFNSFNVDDSQSIVYTNLDGGDYTLIFYVESSDGIKSNEIKINVHKDLKIEEHAWFYPLIISLIILISLLIAFLIFFFIYRSVKNQNRRLKMITVDAVESIARTIDAKDKYTNGHSIRVAKYSLIIAKELNFKKEELENLYYIGLLHDIGKVGIPDNILKKPGKLTDEEYKIMKTHPLIGEDILKKMNGIEHLADGVMYHHERYDGKGYPNGLKGENIPLYGRIICCADSYDAMTSKRVYREKLDKDFVINEFEKCSGSQFDPELVKIVIRLIKENRFTVDDQPLYDIGKI